MVEVYAVCARIIGRVQRVWYRGWTVEEATHRGLAGWVRNRSDGSVEALFAGSKPAVEGMLAACRDGPPHAQVADVTARPAEPPAQDGFRQIPSE